METMNKLERLDDHTWRLSASGGMRVPAIVYGNEAIVRQLDAKVFEQLRNVASLPGIVGAAYAMPDAHQGYGFPVGGVAAFDADRGGVVSAGGVGFDISCGVRTLHTGLNIEQAAPLRDRLADALYRRVPVGMGKRGHYTFGEDDVDRLLAGGARWAVREGYGTEEDLLNIEDHGMVPGAKPEKVSRAAKQRMKDAVGTIGSGNHYAEAQWVDEIYDGRAAAAFGLNVGDVVISVHSGSRGLGHQIGTDFLKSMIEAAPKFGLSTADRELASAPIRSPLGQAYLGAMRSGINCALGNRQVLTHLVREAVAEVFPDARLTVLYDVSHNTCKTEDYEVNGTMKPLYVHRKGATRAFGPGHASLPDGYRAVGQPVLIGGSMGTASYVLVGTEQGAAASFSSACHGAGRAMSRAQATKRWQGAEVVRQLAEAGIAVRSPSMRGIAEEAPDAYKDVDLVVESTHQAALAKKVCRLRPFACIKG